MKGAFIMSHRVKGSPEEKLLFVQKYVKGEISAASASQLAGVKRSSFTNWSSHYRQEGFLGPINTGKNRSYSKNFKTLSQDTTMKKTQF